MEKSSFFNSVNHDRLYQASDFANYFNSLITNGVFPNPSTNLQVLSNGNMTVIVKPGKAWINGHCYYNDSDLIKAIEVADGILSRIDRIVVRFDTTGRIITTVVKKGTFASSPVAPVLQRDSNFYELALADILISNGATSIIQSNITDQRFNTSLCGIVNSLITADSTTLFAQYTDEFNIWFANIQTQLGNDVAGNLQNEINSLAGTGRTTETIKGNADNIATNVLNINNHIIDNTKHVNQSLLNIIGDSGRYQSQANFDGSETYSGAVFDSLSSVLLGFKDGSQVTPTLPSTTNVGQTAQLGIKIHIPNAIPAIKVVLSPYTTGATRLQLLNSSKTLLSTIDITGKSSVIVPYSFSASNDYYILADNNGLVYTASNASVTYPFNSIDVNVVGGIAGTTDLTTTTYNIASVTAQLPTTTGTVIKSFSPSDIDVYGNLKYTQVLNTNNTIVCDVLKADGITVLKPNVSSMVDLSTVDKIANPTIKVRWTLSRIAITDASPTVSIPSVTWEGKDVKVQVAQATFTDTTTSIAANTTYTKTIPLGFNATFGRLHIVGNSPYNSAYSGIIIEFDTIPNNAIASLASNNGVTMSYSRSRAGFVCDASNGIASSPYLQISGCYISGSNLIIVFFNMNSSNAVTLQICKARWEVTA